MVVVNFPAEVLKTKCIEVTQFDASLKTLTSELASCMEQSGGIGLAANQVGLNSRIFMMQCTGKPLYAFINPIITSLSEEKLSYEEGCLSFPGITVNVKRAKEVCLSWQDEHGTRQQGSFTGIEAICIQHELDHLNGITFIDYLGPVKKHMALKKLSKLKK